VSQTSSKNLSLKREQQSSDDFGPVRGVLSYQNTPFQSSWSSAASTTGQQLPPRNGQSPDLIILQLKPSLESSSQTMPHETHNLLCEAMALFNMEIAWFLRPGEGKEF